MQGQQVTRGFIYHIFYEHKAGDTTACAQYEAPVIDIHAYLLYTDKLKKRKKVVHVATGTITEHVVHAAAPTAVDTR